MRHGRKGFKLGRTHSHRKATLAALSTALIKHKSIRTTLTKAKATRQFVEPLITRGREDTTHNRRMVFRYLRDKHAVTELFGDIAERVGERPGGYTRVVKLGQRSGDGAEMAVIELVDYNTTGADATASTRRRTRRAGRRRRRRSDIAGIEQGADAATDVELDASADAEGELEEDAPVEATADVEVEEAADSPTVAEVSADAGDESAGAASDAEEDEEVKPE